MSRAAPSNRLTDTPEECFPKLRALLEYLDSLSDRADLEVLRGLLQDLEIGRDDLSRACLFQDGRYQRNIIKESPWYELVCLCWKSGQRSPIHDHQGSSCAFRIVEGPITEIQFEKSSSGLLTVSGCSQQDVGFICASQDDDIHQVLNANPPGHDTITLHIYSPPLKNYRRYTLDTPCCDGQCQEQSFHATQVCGEAD